MLQSSFDSSPYIKLKHHQLRCFSSEANTPSTSERNTQQPPPTPPPQQHPSLEELFPRQDILNAWGPDLATLDDTFLDRSTRYIVHLLTAQRLNLIMTMSNDGTDDPNAHGGSSGNGAAAAATNTILDRPTTERCNRAIENLILANTVSEGKATRADEILRAMQAFYPLPMTTILPLPTADTYFMVLRLFASDPTACPERAAAIVETMQQRYDEYGQLDHQPNVVHWNQVLSCWAVSATRDEKAFEAANLLQKLQSPSVPQQQPQQLSVQSHSINLDTSSYAHVLRACAKSDWTPKSRMLGAKVALRVYAEFRKRVLQQQEEDEQRQHGESLPPEQPKHSLIPTTYVYTYYFQAIANLSSGSSAGTSIQKQQLQQQRDDAAVAAYHDAVYHGCVNEYVLDNFRQALHNNMQIFRSTVGEQYFGAHYTTTAQLFSRLPPETKRNNGKNSAKTSTSTTATTASSSSSKNNNATES
ncbi:hypothetical protein MHU86_15075 [Fragilaria crotonensis]|nr:hypothetical protein MHU86_15075 [Fragilaria crotonensis]